MKFLEQRAESREQRKSAGDTIVEVAIAIAIIGSVLVGAFASSNRSLSNSRKAEEHTESLKYVEGQVESLKAQASNGSAYTTDNYCFGSDGTLAPLLSAPSSDVASDDFSTARYPAACNVGSIPYHLSVVRTSTLFTIRARWTSVNGGGRDEVKITIRNITAVFAAPPPPPPPPALPCAPVLSLTTTYGYPVSLFNLTWTTPCNSPFTSYRIYSSFYFPNTEVYADFTDGSTNGKIIPKYWSPNFYYFKVSAVNAAGEGPLSNEAGAAPVP